MDDEVRELFARALAEQEVEWEWGVAVVAHVATNATIAALVAIFMLPA